MTQDLVISACRKKARCVRSPGERLVFHSLKGYKVGRASINRDRKKPFDTALVKKLPDDTVASSGKVR